MIFSNNIDDNRSNLYRKSTSWMIVGKEKQLFVMKFFDKIRNYKVCTSHPFAPAKLTNCKMLIIFDVG